MIIQLSVVQILSRNVDDSVTEVLTTSVTVVILGVNVTLANQDNADTQPGPSCSKVD